MAVRGMADVAAGTPVRPETRFQIGSISKSFAAIAVMQEAEAGRLDLDVSVNEILPDLGLPEPFGPITLHHLLTHTAGLRAGTEDAATLAGCLESLRRTPATVAPGERFWYSNDGYKIVGACLERVTGLSLPDLLHERVFGPAGMGSSVGEITDAQRGDIAIAYVPMHADRPPQLRHALVPGAWIVSDTADGSIVSDVVDMSAYARLLLNRGDVPDGRGGRVLTEAMYELLTTPRVDDGEGGIYGYGLWTEEADGHRWIAHSGGMIGFTAYLVTSPDEGLACVILQNGDGGKRDVVRYALAAVRAALAGGEPPPEWVPPAQTAIPDAAAFAGHYEGDDGRRLDVEAEADGLRCRSVPSPFGWNATRSPTRTMSSSVPHPALERFALEFRRDDAGRVVEAFHGETWFRGERYEGPEPGDPPAAWRAMTGTYRSTNAWAPLLRVLLRKGRLWLDWPVGWSDEEGEAWLTPLEDGWFAVGDAWTPRRIRFDGDLDGRPSSPSSTPAAGIARRSTNGHEPERSVWLPQGISGRGERRCDHGADDDGHEEPDPAGPLRRQIAEQQPSRRSGQRGDEDSQRQQPVVDGRFRDFDVPADGGHGDGEDFQREAAPEADDEVQDHPASGSLVERRPVQPLVPAQRFGPPLGRSRMHGDLHGPRPAEIPDDPRRAVVFQRVADPPQIETDWAERAVGERGEGRRWGEWRRPAHAPSIARKATQAFCPPNPNEFDRARRTSSSRASFGVTSRSQFGSGCS